MFACYNNWIGKVRTCSLLFAWADLHSRIRSLRSVHSQMDGTIDKCVNWDWCLHLRSAFRGGSDAKVIKDNTITYNSNPVEKNVENFNKFVTFYLLRSLQVNYPIILFYFLWIIIKSGEYIYEWMNTQTHTQTHTKATEKKRKSRYLILFIIIIYYIWLIHYLFN
jgi:hypothetical protein